MCVEYPAGTEALAQEYDTAKAQLEENDTFSQVFIFTT